MPESVFCGQDEETGQPELPRYPGDPGRDEGAPRATGDFSNRLDAGTVNGLLASADSGEGARRFAAGSRRGGGLLLLILAGVAVYSLAR